MGFLPFYKFQEVSLVGKLEVDQGPVAMDAGCCPSTGHSLIGSENGSLVHEQPHLSGSGTRLENQSLSSADERARFDVFTCVSIRAMLSLVEVFLVPLIQCTDDGQH